MSQTRDNKIWSMHLDSLGLSVRAYNVLFRLELFNLGKISTVTEKKLRSTRNVGRRTIEEIRSLLNSYDLDFGSPDVVPENLTGNAETHLADKKEEIEGDRDKLISACAFSVRSRNAFELVQLKTLGDIAARTSKDLKKIKNFGDSSLNEVRAVLSQHGLHLLDDIAQNKKMKISDCGFSAETLKVFKTGRIKTLREVVKLYEKEHIPSRYLIKKILDEVSAILTQHRFKINNDSFFANLNWVPRHSEMYVKDEKTYYQSHNYSRMAVETLDLALSTLPILNEYQKLEQIGIFTLGDLLLALQRGLPKAQLPHAFSLAYLHQIISAIDNATDLDGKVDWSLYAYATKLPILPNPDKTIQNGRDFLNCLESVANHIATYFLSSVESDILLLRIIRPYKTSFTLDQIGLKNKITRERVRQIQFKLLDRISDAALTDKYSGLRFRFSSGFLQYWKLAAASFGKKESVSYADLIRTLASAWHVREYEIVPHLPLIFAILTRESELPVELREVAEVPIPHELEQIPIKSAARYSLIELNPSRNFFNYCLNRSINNLADLLRACQIGTFGVFRYGAQHLSELLAIINSVSKSLDSSASICWEVYAELRGITIVPKNNFISPDQFIGSLIGSVGEFIGRADIFKRALLVYENRIALDSLTRKTLDQTAALGNTIGPTVAKEQKLLLDCLYRAIFKDDYVNFPVRFSVSFTGFWKEAKSLYSESDSINDFKAKLEEKWQIDALKLGTAIPLIYAVIAGSLYGYPSGNTSRLSELKFGENKFKSDSGENASYIPSVVQLRGFRFVD